MSHDEILIFFAKYIELELGIIYANHNYFQLQHRLEEIAKLMGDPNIEALYERARVGVSSAFKQLLLDVATNNETSFFRDSKVFAAIEANLLPKMALSSGAPIKIWSAASSTGQEALSMAILITEYNLKKKANIQFSILATDISERALNKAKSGVYTQLEVQRGLPTPLLLKYFRKNEDDKWVASSNLLNKINYQKLNLTQPFPMNESFDLVLCRNVLIYQNISSKADIIKKITNLVLPNGYLILGSGESMLGLSNEYEQAQIDGAILFRKRSSLVSVA